MTEAAAHADNVHAARDQHRGVGVAQAVKRHPAHPDGVHLVTPLTRDGPLALIPTIGRGEHWGVIWSLPKAHGEATLLLIAPMLPQLGHQMRRQGDGTPPVARLRPLDPDPAGASFLKRLL